MHSHSTQEPPAPARPWVPLLLIFATLLTAGLLCGDALARLAPVPGLADTDIQPGIALDSESAPRPDDAALDPIVVDAPADRTAGTDPAENSAVDSVVEPAVVEDAPAPANSNGNTNPNAHPNGHTNNAQNGNGPNGNGGQGGKP